MKAFCVLFLAVHLCVAQEEGGPPEVSDEGGSGESSEVTTKKTTTTPEPDLPLENMAGPTRFYFEKNRLPKFLMEVEGDGIIVSMHKNGEFWDKFVLDAEASGSISGGKLNTENDLFQVDVHWKSQTFSGINDPSHKLNGLQLEMIFDIKQNNFELVDMKVVKLDDRLDDVELKVVTSYGYKVSAPLGLSFGCYTPGMFAPKGNETGGNSIGITLPGVRMQVYNVQRGRFGPMWECGNMIPIGLWCGLLVTLGFALVCAYGFSMLASINTMDRFDDPKGKCIYVPNTD